MLLLARHVEEDVACDATLLYLSLSLSLFLSLASFILYATAYMSHTYALTRTLRILFLHTHTCMLTLRCL
jgi:hypothetical protein